MTITITDGRDVIVVSSDISVANLAQCQAAASSAEDSASTATTKAGEAAASEAIATTKAGEAVDSAAAAAASAARVDLGELDTAVAATAADAASTAGDRLAVEGDAAAAAVSAAQAALYEGHWLDDASAISTDTSLTYTAGQPGTVVAGEYVRTRSEGFSYEVAAAAATDQDETTAGGVKLYFRAGGFVGKNGKKYQIVSCVLRQDSAGTGWYAIDDAGHSPVGLDPVTPVSESGGDIVLNYDFTSAKVGSLLITPDEGYANSTLSFGASVGSSSSLISLYHPFWVRMSGTVAVAHSYFGAKGGDWDAVYDVANGTWVVTHPSETHNDAAGSVAAVEGYGDDVNADFYEVTARAKTGFTVEVRQMIHGRTSGASVISENAGPQTVAWDGVSTMTITHPTCSNPNDAMVVSTNALFPAVITASTTTTITVQFLNAATGALYSGASAPANVRYHRGTKAACALTGATKFKAERLGKCKVDAANVASATSNLWVFGVFEVA